MKFNNVLSESYKCVKINGILRNLNNDESRLYSLIKNKGRLFKMDLPEFDANVITGMVQKGLLKKRKLKDPSDKHNGMIYYTTIGRNGHLKGNELEEVAPPGKEAESWIRKNKKRFKEKYGKDYEKYLYGKAWNNYNGKKKVKESAGDDKENKYKQEFIQRVGRHINGVNHFASKIGKSYPNHDYDKLHSQLLNYYYLDKKSDYEELSDEEKDILRKAGMKHRLSNPHHPEFWDKGNIENLTTIRSNPTKPFNCQKMPQSALEEMCADWCSMSEEFGNTPFEWWEKIKNKRYLFTPEQEKFILDTLAKMWNTSVKESEDLTEYDMLVEDITAYHGSPNDFEQFDTKFMGDGQGAQAHGWGLYFALDPKISKKNYQDVYGANHGLVSYKFNGKIYRKPKIMYYVLKHVYERDVSKAIETLEKYLSDNEFKANHPNSEEVIQKYIEEVKKIDPDNVKKSVSLQQGQFYTVKIPDVDNYLAEESAYYNQPIKVQKKLLRIYKKLNINPYHLTQRNIDGERIYDEIKDALDGSKRKASLKLLEYGIKGIYYNGYSDGWCVVVFDHNDVKIVKKENDYQQNEEELPANIMDILLDDPTQIDKYDNLPTEVQVALFNKDNNLINKIKNPTDKFLDYVCQEFVEGNIIDNRKLVILPFIIDKLDEKQRQKLFNEDTLVLFACSDKLSDTELNKYAKLYSDDIHRLADLIHTLQYENKRVIDNLSDKLFNKIFENLYNENLWQSEHFFTYRGFMNSFYKTSGWDYSHYNIADTELFQKLYMYLFPTSVCSHLTDENCKIVDRVFKDCQGNEITEKEIGKCPRFTDLDRQRAELSACDYVLKWANDHSSFVEDIISSEEFISFCGLDKILKVSKNPLTIYNIGNSIRWKPDNHIDFYNLVYIDRYKELRKAKPLNVKEEDIFFSLVRPAIEVFDKIDPKAKINLAKITPHYINRIEKKDLIKIWSDYCDYNMQKQILIKDVSYIRFVPKIDKKVQQAMVDKNPYFVKYLMKPDKQIVKQLIDKYGDEIKDYIRGM